MEQLLIIEDDIGLNQGDSDHYQDSTSPSVGNLQILLHHPAPKN